MNCLSIRKNNIFFLILFLKLNIQVYGQDLSFVKFANNQEFIVEAGDQQYISLSFQIKEDYHIQANKVKDENLIPTSLSLYGSGQVIFGDPIFPETHEFRLEGNEEIWNVYRDELIIRVPVTLPGTLKEGMIPVDGKLYYQACKKSRCFFPRELSFNMEIRVK